MAMSMRLDLRRLWHMTLLRLTSWNCRKRRPQVGRAGCQIQTSGPCTVAMDVAVLLRHWRTSAELVAPVPALADQFAVCPTQIDLSLGLLAAVVLELLDVVAPQDVRLCVPSKCHRRIVAAPHPEGTALLVTLEVHGLVAP